MCIVENQLFLQDSLFGEYRILCMTHDYVLISGNKLKENRKYRVVTPYCFMVCVILFLYRLNNEWLLIQKSLVSLPFQEDFHMFCL